MKQYNNYADLITFTRASSGTALRPISYGDELVVNGTFDSDISNWTDISTGTADISYSSGALSLNTIDTSNRGQAEQAITTQIGGVYFYTFTVTATTYIKIGTTSQGTNIVGATQYAAGTHTVSFVAPSNSTYLTFYSISNTTTLDNVSVREVLFDQPDGTLTLFNHPTNIPRIEYDSDGNRLGLLVEESRTNLITYSEDFTQWGTLGTGSLTAGQTAPDGSATATLISNTSDFRVYSSIGFDAGAGYRRSIWAKVSTEDLLAGRTDVYLTGNYQLSPSTLTTLTDEWVRYDVEVASGTGIGNFHAIDFRQSGSEVTATNVYVWGAQLEAGSFPTSYIPTSGSTATRSADVASIGVSEFGYNQEAVTVLVEADYRNWQYSSSFNRIIDLGRTTTSVTSTNGIFNQASSGSGTLRFRFDNEAASAQFGAANLTGSNLVTSAKIAFALKLNDMAICYNGGNLQSVTSGDAQLNSLDIIALGANWSEFAQATQDYLNGHIKSLKVYPRRLTNSQLVEITS